MYQELVEKQRAYFLSGVTISVAFRKKQLRKLESAIVQYTGELQNALYLDFKKSEFEAYLTEIGMSKQSLKTAINHVRKWSNPKKVRSSILNFPSSEYISPDPYGVSLIIGPWNYPVLLTLDPLIAAIAAGNCCILKPSELTPHTSTLIEQILKEIYEPEYITVVQGDASITQGLLSCKFDKIFFTGSPHVGKIVYQAAAANMTPVTLELGGKSPCIVTPSANLKVAAHRIIWGKMINAGQTCVAPDFIYVHHSVKDRFLSLLCDAIQTFYGTAVEANSDFPRIINQKNFERLQSFLTGVEIFYGGKYNEKDLFIEPTILNNISWEDNVMQEEIFGPVLPVLTYDSLTEVVEKLHTQEKPLAFYVFSNNKKEVDYLHQNCHFGGGCVNDTISHLINTRLPFGGVGNSGLGVYHGEFGFQVFSHPRAIVNRDTWLDIPVRYPPYKKKVLQLIKKFF